MDALCAGQIADQTFDAQVVVDLTGARLAYGHDICI